MERLLYAAIPIKEQKEGIPFEKVISKIDNILLETITCPICHKLVWDLVDCSQCGYIFCRSCIFGLLTKENNSCPMCHHTPFNSTKCLTIKKILSNIRIKCPYTSCQKKPLYSDYIEHQRECKFRIYKCNNEGCNYENCLNNKDEMISHSKECPYREINCIYCGEKIKAVDSNEHINKFCKELIECTACKYKMRKNYYMNNHDKYHCLQLLILHFINMPNKINKNVASLLIDRVGDLKNNFNNQVEQLKKDNEILSEEIKKLTEKNINSNHEELENKSMLNQKRKRSD